MQAHIKTDRDGIYKMRLTDGVVTETVFEYEGVDARSILFDHRNKPLGIAYRTERTQYHLLDREFAAKWRGIDQALKGRVNLLTDKSVGGRFWTIYSHVMGQLGQYFALDTQTNELHFLGARYNLLKNEHLGTVQHVVYQARDGLAIPAYLTLPVGREAKKLPFVIFPHGGPHSRYTERFDYMAQFLASRGNGVIQPNFRGSSGYGMHFKSLGEGEWGRAMQDDVTDATHWVVEQGYADTDRICAAGLSYGGYAVLMALVREPALYKCAIDDLSLSDISPRHQAKSIKGAVLLIQGDLDRVVSKRHGRAMRKALKSAKVRHVYIEQEDGDHSLSYEPHRIETLIAIRDLLEEHL